MYRFERSTRSVVLTKQGKILRDRAYSILNEYEATLIELDGSKTVQGALRIAGCSRFPVINEAMNDEVSRFERSYRDVDIAIDDIFARDFRKWLADGTYDVICSLRLPELDEKALDFIPLFEMEVCAWVPPKSKLAHKQSTSFEELSDYVIRYMEPQRSRLLTSYYRSLFEQRGLHIQAGRPLTPTLYMAENEFCLFPFVEGPSESLPNIVQVRIDDPAKLSVCWIRRKKTVNPLTDLFFRQITETVPSA